MPSTRIIRYLSDYEFHDFLRQYKNRITVNEHAYFRLSEMQRKVYKEGALLKTLKEEKPIRVGIQQNGRYAAFYHRKEGYLRIVFKVSSPGIEIITFYLMDYLPQL